MLPDSVMVGYGLEIARAATPMTVTGVNSEAFEYTQSADISKALYGKIAGLTVRQGTGSSADNVSSLKIHGNAPLVLIDGYPREITDITSEEIESVFIMTDAVSSALYGVRGGNGILMITTRKGNSGRLDVNAGYSFGLSTRFRAPEPADAFTYACAVNAALANDGLGPRYNANELAAFKDGSRPYGYPDVDWVKETMNDIGTTHSLKLTFDGGGDKFRYFIVTDYYRDRSMLKENTEDDRYSTRPTDTRLSVRANMDLELTTSTSMTVGLSARLQELNGTAYGRNNVFNTIYGTPAAAFPVRHENGIYGGNSIYGDANPYAVLNDKGHIRNMYGTLLADVSLRQKLDMIAEGLSAGIRASFDNKGGMKESSGKSYRYMSLNPSLDEDGNYFTDPVFYGSDSQTLGHSQSFESLDMMNTVQADISYMRSFGKHDVHAAAIYDMSAAIINGRNRSFRNQSLILKASYVFADRYAIDAAVSHSGSSYLPDGSRFHTYPAVAASWVISNEGFMSGCKAIDLLKLRTSYGISGWDGNLTHELWRQSYGTGGSYYFGSNSILSYGGAEGGLPVEGLVPERMEKLTAGVDLEALSGRLRVSADGFTEFRSNVLVSGAASTSGIIGTTVGRTCEGEYLYKGFDITLTWYEKRGDFSYGMGTSMSYLTSEIINDNQEYQEYDYLYRKGNRVGQKYGLEAIGFFGSQLEINNSPQQTFSDVRPGDVRYKDQNGDNVIDSKDVVRMFGSSLPRFYFGLSLEMGYRNFGLEADFQGMTGVTVSLLDSFIHNPLAGNGNIMQTFLDYETPWSPEDKAAATMPGLSVQNVANNRQNSSLWYRDGSFIKLRSLVLSYTFDRSKLRFAQMKVFLQGNNLFSLDNLGFADPEQLQAAYPSVRTWWAGIKFNF